jgi:hypothetical protein
MLKSIYRLTYGSLPYRISSESVKQFRESPFVVLCKLGFTSNTNAQTHNGQKVIQPSAYCRATSIIFFDQCAHKPSGGTFIGVPAKSLKLKAMRSERYITYRLYLSVYGSVVHLLDLGCLFSFLILYTADGTPWAVDESIARPLLTQKTTETE